MLDQEMASIMHFVLQHTGDPTPYYGETPEGFEIPAVFFPPPEVSTDGDTLTAYRLAFDWFIKVFANCTPDACALAFAVLEAVQMRRNEIPVVDEDGAPNGELLTVGDPEMKPLQAAGAAQLSLKWNSRRPYLVQEGPRVQSVELQIRTKAAYQSAVRNIEGGRSVS